MLSMNRLIHLPGSFSVFSHSTAVMSGIVPSMIRATSNDPGTYFDTSTFNRRSLVFKNANHRVAPKMFSLGLEGDVKRLMKEAPAAPIIIEQLERMRGTVPFLELSSANFLTRRAEPKADNLYHMNLAESDKGLPACKKRWPDKYDKIFEHMARNTRQSPGQAIAALDSLATAFTALGFHELQVPGLLERATQNLVNAKEIGKNLESLRVLQNALSETGWEPHMQRNLITAAVHCYNTLEDAEVILPYMDLVRAEDLNLDVETQYSIVRYLVDKPDRLGWNIGDMWRVIEIVLKNGHDFKDAIKILENEYRSFVYHDYKRDEDVALIELLFSIDEPSKINFLSKFLDYFSRKDGNKKERNELFVSMNYLRELGWRFEKQTWLVDSVEKACRKSLPMNSIDSAISIAEGLKEIGLSTEQQYEKMKQLFVYLGDGAWSNLADKNWVNKQIDNVDEMVIKLLDNPSLGYEVTGSLQSV